MDDMLYESIEKFVNEEKKAFKTFMFEEASKTNNNELINMETFITQLHNKGDIELIRASDGGFDPLKIAMLMNLPKQDIKKTHIEREKLKKRFLRISMCRTINKNPMLMCPCGKGPIKHKSDGITLTTYCPECGHSKTQLYDEDE